MAAPLGFKTFNTGDILSASDTNGYLMQGVLVFADAAARSAAITSPQEGQTSYLKDTDVIQVYSGSAWVTKSGGSSPLTTKGDLYTYGTGDTRLGVGANGTTLVADSSTATGLKWAAPASTSFPAFSAYPNADQTLTTNTFTKLQLNTEEFDTNSNFDSTTNYRFTPTVAGYYQINAMAYLYGNSSGNQILSIYKNGVQHKTRMLLNQANGSQSGLSALIYFNGTTDYIELYGRQTAATAISSAGPIDCYLDGVGIRS